MAIAIGPGINIGPGIAVGGCHRQHEFYPGCRVSTDARQ